MFNILSAIIMTKNALITGAAKRIGKNIALSMAKDGWNIAIHCNSSLNEAKETASEAVELGQKAFIIQGDLSNSSQVRLIFDEAASKLGNIDCLINNASYFANDTIDNLSAESMHKNMQVNYYAPTLLSQYFAKYSKNGNIINILDYCVKSLPDKFNSHAISRAAMWNSTQIIAKQLAPNIRVNAIGLGHAMINNKEKQGKFDEVIAKTPLGVATGIEEICNAVKFIISSPSMTGELINLDSGKHLITADYY